MDASLPTATNSQPEHSALRSAPELAVSELLQPRRRLSVGFWLFAAALFLLALCLAVGMAAHRRVQAAAQSIADVEDQVYARVSAGERLTTAVQSASISAREA